MRWKERKHPFAERQESSQDIPNGLQERQGMLAMAAEAANFYISLPNPIREMEESVDALIDNFTPVFVQNMREDGGVACAKAIDGLYDRYFSEVNRRLSSKATSLALACTIERPKEIDLEVCPITEPKSGGRMCGKVAGKPMAVWVAPESRHFYFASSNLNTDSFIAPLSFFSWISNPDIKGQYFTGLQLHELLDHADTAPIVNVAATARDLLELRNSRYIFEQSGRPACDLSIPVR